jgi:hypothetical protein
MARSDAQGFLRVIDKLLVPYSGIDAERSLTSEDAISALSTRDCARNVA